MWVYGASALSALVLLGVFWYLRIIEQSPIVPANAPPPNPIRSIGRFLAQARLRLAWAITFGRSSWWGFFFIYPPIYMIKNGLGETAGALLVSAGNAMLFATPVFGRLAGTFGVRRVLRDAFLCCGVLTLGAAALFNHPLLVAVMLTAGALACVALDSVGNIPFLRAVRARERAEMTTVFRTYIDISELIPPAVFAAILSVFDLQMVFIVMGAAMIGFSLLARYLPKSM